MEGGSPLFVCYVALSYMVVSVRACLLFENAAGNPVMMMMMMMVMMMMIYGPYIKGDY